MNTLTPGTIQYTKTKKDILTRYSVTLTKNFNAKVEIRKRIDYLKEFLVETKRKAFVLGISGGVDSSTAGRLCQLACTELRNEGYVANFIAMRLPAGVQKDETDAQKSVIFIQPDKLITVNVGECANLINIQGLSQYEALEQYQVADSLADYHKGNIKARLRMVAQYHIAALYEGLVVGTDHNAECVMGFYTLHGDGACDLTVLNGMNKRQIRLMAKELGAPASVWTKPPTADLEELNPGKLDDEGFGFDYQYLDDFLEGFEIPLEIEAKIVNQYKNTSFKRKLPTSFEG